MRICFLVFAFILGIYSNCPVNVHAAGADVMQAATLKAPSKVNRLKQIVSCAFTLGILTFIAEPIIQVGSDVVHRGASIVYPHGTWLGERRLKWGTLTPFWAQEYIGADLAREEIASEKNLVPVNIAIWDSGLAVQTVPPENLAPDFRVYDENDTHQSYDDVRGNSREHGTQVASLILGREPIGVSSIARLKLFSAVRRPSTPFRLYSPADQSAEKLDDESIRLIGTSYRMAERQAQIVSAHQRQKGIIIVTAAGNNSMSLHQVGWRYARRALGMKNYSKAIGIAVGSIAPDGRMSSFSMPGPQVVIAAPSDVWVQAINHKGEQVSFSGTSGAQPLVTGSLANALGYLPDLTQDEAIELLTKTAIPTSNSAEVPRRNGAGTVNAYKLVKVARYLRDHDWSHRRAELLADTKTYDFSKEAAEMLQKGKALLKQNDLSTRVLGARLIRGSLLLEPTSEAQELLVGFYEAEGLSSNAKFYKSIIIR